MTTLRASITARIIAVQTEKQPAFGFPAPNSFETRVLPHKTNELLLILLLLHASISV